MKRIVLAFVALFLIVGTPAVAFAQPATDAGISAPVLDAGSAVTAPAATPPVLQASDVSVATKLWHNGSFFALGILAVFVGLSVWLKVDKKHAFYAATALGGVGLLVDAIRRGDTPTASAVVSALTTTVGILIAGPGHVKAG